MLLVVQRCLWPARGAFLHGATLTEHYERREAYGQGIHTQHRLHRTVLPRHGHCRGCSKDPPGVCILAVLSLCHLGSVALLLWCTSSRFIRPANNNSCTTQPKWWEARRSQVIQISFYGWYLAHSPSSHGHPFKLRRHRNGVTELVVESLCGLGGV